MTSPVTHEAFIHGVRAIVAVRLADDPTRARLLDAKLVYGSGERGTRGVCYFEAWQNGHPHDFLEVCATGEESPVQLAGTTIHELAHCLAGRGAGHGPDWKRACHALGLTVAQAAGQAYAPEHFAPEVWTPIAALPVPTDGVPAFASGGAGPFVGLPVAPTPRPCLLGAGTRGGRSRGAGSGSRLRLWVCACTSPVRVRVASDDFRARCLACGTAGRWRDDRPNDGGLGNRNPRGGRRRPLLALCPTVPNGCPGRSFRSMLRLNTPRDGTTSRRRRHERTWKGHGNGTGERGRSARKEG